MDRESGDLAATPSEFSPRKPAYRRDIDGLRAIAVTSVVLYHADLWPLTSGYVGVDIFFVISGFLIGGILNREIRSGSFTFKNFYTRRARRILPALIAVVTIVSLVSLMLMGARELRQAGLSAGTALVGISNVYFWWSTNYFDPSAHLNPFLMTWSLGVEEQFYVFFPVLLLLLARKTGRQVAAVILMLSAISLIICVAGTARYPLAAFYLLPARAWELGAGALLALYMARPVRAESQMLHHLMGMAGLATVICSCLIFSDATPFPGIAAIVPVAGTLALIFAERSWVNRHILSTAPMVGIGLVSYSWYLWHAPLMALVRLVHFGTASVSLMCITALVSLGCAWLSWRFVEQPFRHGTLPPAPALRRYGVALIACMILPATFIVSHGLPVRLGRDGRAIERTLALGRGNPCLVSYGVSEPSAQPSCVKRNGKRGSALLGDSHAAALGGAMAALSAKQNVDFIQYEKSSCPPLLGATHIVPQHPAHARECAAFNQKVFDRVARDPSVETVLLAGFWSDVFQGDANNGTLGLASGAAVKDQSALLRSALSHTIRKYQSAGKRVIVIADVPLLRFNPGKETIGDIMPVRASLRSLLGAPSDVSDGYAARRWLRPKRDGDRIVEDVARAIPAVIYYDPASFLCDARRCAYARNVPYYIDFQHLSRPGAEQALQGLDLAAQP